ncbi:hypothetical protein EIN_362980 [Entamoeba invadens IP1]|uniref:Uncharacterized protein n=1 Tax=Entamoeba invadens IP1 TaxID=370355 RepID=A0A0A1U821_ENTIV|nr:hypothetical protein EIN_362980 [Entamoeba invadens IP1]ELP90945.1 hypothetical protein EIN_362980 [Entamoeba invadens IP1]|eukprot:XP_004257716.1 hypothetical protein EIN_362980 [Entamoeba invadens IP1]
MLTYLSEDSTKKLLVVPFEQFGCLANPACMPNKYMKVLLFTVKCAGKGYIFKDTRKCVKQANGVHVKLDSDGKKKYLSFLSEDYRASIIMTVSIICPNNCNLENVIQMQESVYVTVVMVDKIFTFCRRIFVNLGQKTDQYCRCTQKVYKTICQTGRTCDTSLNYTLKAGVCVYDKCGNGMIDNYYDSNGKFIRKEECDGGVNCNITCQCIEGHVQSSNDFLSYKKLISTSTKHNNQFITSISLEQKEHLVGNSQDIT